MADRGDTHYHVPNLNLWFAFSSVLLLISCVWMVLDDWSRPWKQYQREFRAIETQRSNEALATPEAAEAMAQERILSQELETAQQSLDARRSELEEAEEELRQLKGKQFIATEAAKKAKQQMNWERWEIEEQRIHLHDPDFGAEEIKAFEDTFYELDGAKQVADENVLAQQARIKGLTAQVTEVETSLKAATKDIDLARKRLASLAPEDVPTKVANVIRDFPGMDFIGPNLKVQKVVLEDLTFELNFTKKKRIDMCMTCHMAIDREGYDDPDPDDDDDGQPHLSHPNLDLYMTAKSPHPMNAIGCTICHRGSGESLDFQRADHRPSDEEEGHEWYEEYHWHKQHYWDYPMLSSAHVEASCVQCHKDSMELIADDAPKVTEGFRLFERYGCYSCHKVDWYPEDRRPGPSLKGLRQKTNKDFVDAWIAAPRDFRPTTWMPQIFHLENYAPEQTIVVSEYGNGRPILGQEWNDSAVAAVSTFIWDRASEEPLPPIPVEGDADRGAEVFRLSGCLACHNMTHYTEADAEAEEYPDIAFEGRETNEHGPNLRGVATKVSPEWLFAWIKNPTAYWSETRMPNLRLSDQDAADVVAYMTEDPDGVFTDVPEGWETGESPYDMEVLKEQARWFFNRTSRDELDRLFAEEWSDDRELLRAVGERHVLNQGCHSCHEIGGLENAMPVGTELTNWGSKTVDKLDFGLIPDIFKEEKGWTYHEKTEFKQYREGWLAQKLHEPRSYDRQKIKNPTERLRMPWFDFDKREIDALVTFTVGLVDDEVKQAKMIPTPEQVSMNKGLQVIRQKNCASCHVIEPGTIEFLDEDGAPHQVRGQLVELEGELLPPPMEDFQAYVADYLEFMREDDDEFELEDVSIQLLEPAPGLGEAGSTVVVENWQSIRATPSWGGDLVEVVTEHYLYAEEGVEDVDGEVRDYADEAYTKIRWTFAPPVLLNEGAKLQREWFYSFLVDPEPLRQQVRVKMPTFNWEEGEAGAVADYFANRAVLDWPSQYARKLLLALEKTPEEIAAEMPGLGITGCSSAQIQGIVDGKPVETAAALSKLLAYGSVMEFQMDGPVDPGYEAIVQRAHSLLGPLLDAKPDFFQAVRTLAIEGPNCVQCHFLQGQPPTQETPIAWAPDLDFTRERLRPDWVREWLTDPNKIYPGTSMPANFPLDQTVWQELYPAPSAEQIEAVVTWLFNLDRTPQN